MGIVQPSTEVWLCLAHSSYIRTFGRSSCTGTLQMGRYQVSRWPQAARWAQCTYIDIHFFSGRQRTSSSISIFGQILIARRTCDYLNAGKVRQMLSGSQQEDRRKDMKPKNYASREKEDFPR